MGQRLSAGKPTEDIKGKLGMPAGSKMVSFSRSRRSLVVPSCTGHVYIPLLLSDIVCAAVPGCSDDGDASHQNGVEGQVTAGFVIVIGPRGDNSHPCEEEEEEEDVAFNASSSLSTHLTNGLGERLPRKAWLLCIGNCDSVGLQRILFELGSFGALRWDSQQTYMMTKHELASGACGTLWLGQAKNAIINPNSMAMDKLGVAQVAMKLIRKSGMEVEAQVQREVNILTKIQDHPNITTLFGVFGHWEEGEHVRDSSTSSPSGTPDSEASHQQPDSCFQKTPVQMLHLRWRIVLSFGSDGNLFDFVSVRGVLSQTTCVEMMMGTLSAIAHLHNRCIVHRDVKCENIFVSRCQPMLTDFGIAAHLFDYVSMSRWKGTPGYAAPEVVSCEPCDERIDIFSAGVVMYAMLSGKKPFDDQDLQSVLAKTVRCKVSFRHDQFQALSRSLGILLKKLLAKEPDERPAASLALKALMRFTEQVDHKTVGQDSDLRLGNAFVNTQDQQATQHGPKGLNIFQILHAASSRCEQGLCRSIVPVPEGSNQQGQDVALHQPEGTKSSRSEVPRWRNAHQLANSSDIQKSTAPPLQPPALSQAPLQQQQKPAQCSALAQGSKEAEAAQSVPPETPKPRFTRWVERMSSRVSQAASSSSSTTSDVSSKQNPTSTKADANVAKPPSCPKPNYPPRPRPSRFFRNAR
eukprot:TRINITY_DN11333_c0_g1_i2.p1 TRINITY_DN11333_c0_g1~~TRINITY_DN11333_c0_g1_i2.p1  ORF type:complete len:764 (-),score=114.02 TRINITY_DN11333_c0_g1_i2:122-2191(-)